MCWDQTSEHPPGSILGTERSGQNILSNLPQLSKSARQWLCQAAVLLNRRKFSQTLNAVYCWGSHFVGSELPRNGISSLGHQRCFHFLLLGTPLSSIAWHALWMISRTGIAFCAFIVQFLSDPGIPGIRSMGPDVSNSVQEVL